MRDFADAHDRHCCPVHGCKYGDHDCTVESGEHPGIRCEFCDMQSENVSNMTEKDIELMVSSMSEAQLMFLKRLLEKS